MADSLETAEVLAQTAFQEAEKRARGRGLTRDEIDRELEDDGSQFWADIWEISNELQAIHVGSGRSVGVPELKTRPR